MSSLNHVEIRDRYLKEQENILRFAHFLSYELGFDRMSIIRINSTLEAHCLGSVPMPSMLSHEPPTRAEMLAIVRALEAIEPQLPGLLKSYEGSYVDPEAIVFSSVGEANYKTLEKWVNKAIRLVPAHCGTETIDKLKNDLKRLIVYKKALTKLSNEELDLFVDDAAEYALRLEYQRRIENLQWLNDTIQHLKFLSSLSKPDVEINAYRQSFILLMTAFDAAVFDLARAALRKNFFPFISYFGKEAKVVLEDLGDFKTIEEFIDFVTEAQLKRRYLKDILRLLYDVGVPLFDVNGYSIAHLTELVLRRNLHVHNRGVVDRFYLEQNKNVYNLKLDKSAEIDEIYWMRAISVCRLCVFAISDWIERGAPVPKKNS